MTQRTLDFESEREFHKLYAEDPRNLQQMEKALECKVVARGTSLSLEGADHAVDQAEVFFQLLESARKQGFHSCVYD